MESEGHRIVREWREHNRQTLRDGGVVTDADNDEYLMTRINAIIRREVAKALGADAAEPWHVSQGHDAEEGKKE